MDVRADTPRGEDASDENITAVVPNSVELRVDLEETGSEVKGLLAVVLALFLGVRVYKRNGGAPAQSTLTLARTAAVRSWKSLSLARSRSFFAASASREYLTRFTPC